MTPSRGHSWTWQAIPHFLLLLLSLPLLLHAFQQLPPLPTAHPLRYHHHPSSVIRSAASASPPSSSSPGPPLPPRIELSQVEIRQATRKDFPAIAAARNAVIFVPKKGGAGVFVRQAMEIANDEEREILAKIPYLMTGQAIAFIAVGYPKTGPKAKQPRLVGTVDVFLREKEGTLPRRLFLKNMIIDEAFRRQGFAKRLLARVEEHAREVGVQNLSLEVLGNNQGAMLLYESQGYEYTTNPFDLLGRALKIGRVTMTKSL